MGMMNFPWLMLITLTFTATTTLAHLKEGKQKYVVYMGRRKEHENPETLSLSHHNMLMNLIGSEEEAQQSLVHNYKYAFKGFSAWLTSNQAAAISRSGGVVSVFPSRKLNLLTTRSWNFLGMNSNVIQSILYNASSDVIVGVIDTGIWPESESFRDNGFSPVPSRWKGKCDNSKVTNTSHNINCNNKVIGVRSYDISMESSKFPNGRDDDGHGTHTSSTIAGGLVKNKSFLGLASGDARGGFPNARIAIYRVCSAEGCSDDGILAAFDDALNDGVDILSLSLGSFATDYDQDSIAIGSFHAMEKGVLVSCAAGNDGPNTETVSNGAPWILTVGASSIDRTFVSYIKLANNKTLPGVAANLNEMKKQWTHLITGFDAVNHLGNPAEASFCAGDSLDANKVRGKIVVCTYSPGLASIESITYKLAEMKAGGVILGSNDPDTLPYFTIPGSVVDTSSFNEIISYMNTTRNALATIIPTQTVYKQIPAPRIASFSSRGPHKISPDVLKPDVVAPGVNVLAAWPPIVKVNTQGKPIYSNFNIISGTSMACPHVTGAAAFLKSIHPSWTPAAIRSALMTTASPVDDNKKPLKDYDGTEATPFASGAGEIQPIAAANPGLIYDLAQEDYVNYLCSSNYTALKYELITGRSNITCSKEMSKAGYLNYPSITLLHFSGSASVSRTVTNVGAPNSTYSLLLNTPKSLSLEVVPKILHFTKAGEKVKFEIKFNATKERRLSDWAFGSFTWKNGNISVRSPFAVKS